MKSNQPNNVFSGLFWVYLENTSAQLISFIVTVVLARLLEPTHYGTIALLTVFIALAQVFVTNGISSALIQKKDADELDYSTMFWFNLVVSVALYFLLFFSAPAIGEYYKQEELSLVLRILAFSIPLSAYNCIQQAWVSSHMVFKKSFLSNSGGGILSGIIGIVMAYGGCGLWALVAQRILHVAFNTILLKIIIDWRPLVSFSYERLKPMFSFGWKMMATSFMFTGYSQLRSLVIGKRYSAADLGYYDRGFSFPNLIASNIDSTITRVLFPALANAQGESISLADKSRRAAKTSAFIMTPILWGLAIIATPLVELLLGDKWLPCVPYLQIMCFVWWLQPTQTCSAQAIKAIGRSDLYLYIELISKAIGLALLGIAVFIFDTVFAIAVMYLIGQLSAVLIYGYYSHKYIGYKIHYQLADLVIPGFLAAIMGIIVVLMSHLSGNGIWGIVIQITSGTIAYVLLAHLLKVESFSYICNLLKSHNRKI